MINTLKEAIITVEKQMPKGIVVSGGFEFDSYWWFFTSEKGVYGNDGKPIPGSVDCPGVLKSSGLVVHGTGPISHFKTYRKLTTEEIAQAHKEIAEG